ncbi:conserved hypothetical protein [Histoplasma capsulatum var. duboisii H88]|uniref:AMP-binding and other domain-containing protein n=1 Tax=Ajellomyces capsulatus (strain H88) TaxID=544711 RepID=F0UQ92_AJEC8|nr:conserved hypothetical protein [Histoplasma capsulatum var. duboisii H88]QSS53264.1 AMP-binding and other domain-containing protein [Histoplasma capsulatum var. duboisii H88]
MPSSNVSLSRVDVLLSDLFADWSTDSTLIASFIAIFLAYKLFFSKDPDTHPFFLARQAVRAPIRLPGESASFRAHDVPHGYPLKSGLNVKDPDKPKWTAGRNGDLRDIWRAALRGSLATDGTPAGKQGKFYTVLGKDVAEHKLDDISQEINIIGQYIYESRARTVAIYLPDSVETLAAIFAGAFYGFKIVLIPRQVSSERLRSYLAMTSVDLLIAEAGTLELSALLQGAPSLRSTIWVANHGSRHMDWSQVPEGIGGDIEVAVWHELVKDKKALVGTEVPATVSDTPTHPIVAFWATSAEEGQFVEYSPAALVAGIAGLGSVLPHGQHLTSSDLVLSIDSLTRSYPLCIILAALYVNASVAFNSVSGEHVNFALATAGISPTIIIASSETMQNYHTEYMAPQIGLVAKFGRFIQRRSLDGGSMPRQNILTKLANLGPTAELSLENLRLIFISYRIDANPECQLTFEQLTDLRVFTGARVIYALTAPTVVGAVSQTNAFDYRSFPGHSHFGAPLSNVEIKLIHDKEEDASKHGRLADGKIFVTGPATVGGKSLLEARGYFNDDCTLSLS